MGHEIRNAAVQPKASKKRRLSPKTRNIIIACLIMFIAANIFMAILYRGKVLPHYYLGKLSVGGMSTDSLSKIPSNQILPSMVVLKKEKTTVIKTSAQLGFSVDANKSVQNVNTWIRWVPLLSLVTKHHVALNIQVDNAKFDHQAKIIAAKIYYPAMDKHIVFNGTEFEIAPAHDGYKLDSEKLRSSLSSTLQRGKTSLTVPTTSISVKKSNSDLTASLNDLQKKLNLKIGFVYHGQTVITSKSDIGKWYVSSGQTLKPSKNAIAKYISGVGKKFGVSVANPFDMSDASAYALNTNQSMNFAITPATSNTFIRSYCTAVDGVSASTLAVLNGKLAATYNDVRGWNDNGTIAFKRVASGCQYTVWMAASSQMSSFGSICDDYYNCQVGTNVVLNYNRWTTATQPWNTTGGNLENYRTLMIDHETGHRLGFRDNNNCPGAGQRAPVMMQQSVALKGCIFNIWPLATEFAQLNRMIGAGQTSSVTNLQ